MDDVADTTLAGRELRGVIADDLVSSTYAAFDPFDDHMVSLRVVADDLCIADGPDAELYERFHRRAAAALTFEHPNAPAVEEVGDDRGRGYLVTAHVESVSLASWVARRGPLPVDEALSLFSQVADVLDSLHRDGLTHGAVNPVTLRIAQDGDRVVPYLTGYGIGALLELRLRRDRKHLRVVNDLLYVAPEQLRRQPLTGRTDQYAMACAMVHVLTGAPPFERGTVGGLFGAHLFVDPDGDVDQPWVAATRKGMAKQPRDRYATCAQLVDDVAYARRRAAVRRRLAARRAMAGHGMADPATDPNGAGTVEPDARPRAPATNGTAAHGATDRGPAATDRAGTAAPVPPAGARDAAAERGRRGAPNGPPTPPTPAATPTGARDAEEADGRDNSATARRPTASMAYPAGQEEGSAGMTTPGGPPGELDDVPLLSEVLRHRPPAREPAGWRPPGVLVMLVLIALAAAAVTVWVVGT